MANTSMKVREEGRLGPAMQALTFRQRAFVVAMLELGTSNHTRAARAAGYEGNDNTMKVTAHRLAHDEKVQTAMREEAGKRLTASTTMAVSTLITIAEDQMTQTKDRLKAIEMILNRTGLHATTEHKVEVNHTSSDTDVLTRIALLAKRLGLDETKLIGSIGMQVIDGEFTEVNNVEAYDEFATPPS